MMTKVQIDHDDLENKIKTTREKKHQELNLNKSLPCNFVLHLGGRTKLAKYQRPFYLKKQFVVFKFEAE